MGYAHVWTTTSVASTTGGTFADTSVANSGDSTSVANFGTATLPNGMGARIVDAFGIDSVHTGELEVYYTRQLSTHDQQHGWRSQVMAAAFNTAGHVKAVRLLTGPDQVELFPSDTPTLSWTSTASDCVIYAFTTEYADLPGTSAAFVTPSFVFQNWKSRVGIYVNAESSTATAGAYGATRAINADDDRLHANTWYAILGLTAGAPFFGVTLIGPDWGGVKIGIPAGSIEIMSEKYFMDAALAWNAGGQPTPTIPIFNSNNKGNILLSVVDASTSLSPGIDLSLVELTLPSTWTPQSGGIA
jgi:hypothetical protein